MTWQCLLIIQTTKTVVPTERSLPLMHFTQQGLVVESLQLSPIRWNMLEEVVCGINWWTLWCHVIVLLSFVFSVCLEHGGLSFNPGIQETNGEQALKADHGCYFYKPFVHMFFFMSWSVLSWNKLYFGFTGLICKYTCIWSSQFFFFVLSDLEHQADD